MGIKNLWKYFFLFLFSLLSAIVWRIEIEITGYTGLYWIHVFHFSVIIGLLLLFTWLFIINQFFLNVTKGKLAIVAYLLCNLILARILFPAFFLKGPGVLSAFFFADVEHIPFLLRLIQIVAVIWFFSGPIGLFFLLRGKLRDFDHRVFFAGMILYFLSFPLSLFFMWIVNDKGGIDLIHTIKNGYLIPFLFIGVGFMFFNPIEKKAVN